MTEARTLHARTHASCILEPKQLAGIRAAIRRALGRRGWHDDEVDDLTQETLLAVLLRDTFWGMSARDRENYAVRVSIGLAANHARAAQRRAKREAAWADACAQEQRPFEDDVDELELRACAYVALLRLPEDLFAIALCRFLRGQSIGEIAAARGLSVGTTKSRIRRARREIVDGLAVEPTREELRDALRSLMALELHSEPGVARAQLRLAGLARAMPERREMATNPSQGVKAAAAFDRDR